MLRRGSRRRARFGRGGVFGLTGRFGLAGSFGVGDSCVQSVQPFARVLRASAVRSCTVGRDEVG